MKNTLSQKGRFFEANLFTLLELMERNFLCERIIKKQNITPNMEKKTILQYYIFHI